MQFAPVANLGMYRELAYRGLLGNYQLMIATEVSKDPGAWSDFWHSRDVGDQFIIMDNGLIEAGAPTDPQTLKDAADAVSASCIVLPDVLGVYDKTVKAVKASISELRQTGYPLLGVVQGTTWYQVDAIGEFYREIGVQFLSVPRVMVSIFGTRISLIHRLKHLGLPIHLLGFSNNLWDDMLSANQPGVRGIDSATPLWYRGVLPPTPPPDADFGRRPADFWEMSPDVVNYKNVERVQEWLNVVSGVRSQGTRQEPEATQQPQSVS